MENIICVIPARSGSKRLPNKNIIKLLNKPLIAYTIEAANNSNFKPRVVVSTDSKEFATISINYGAEVPFLRSRKLAKDNVHAVYPVIDTLDFLKKNENYTPEIVVMLQPTSPLRNTLHIDEALELYKEKKNGSIVSVTETKPPHYIRTIVKGQLKPIIDINNMNYQQQDFSKYYMGNGAIYITSPDNLVKQQTFKAPPAYPYIMEKKYSIDIDDKEDLLYAEALLKSS